MPTIHNLSTHDAETVGLLKTNVESFPSIKEAGDAFARCFDSFGGSKILLIGDASHGTSEFYTARAEITKYMIINHGFNIVATESDWPDAESLDRYVRHRPRLQSGTSSGDGDGVGPLAGDVQDEEPVFKRFPMWMWRNRESGNFIQWLWNYNRGTDPHDAVGFYGLDLYSLGASMRAVIRYLDHADRDMAVMARQRYANIMEWAEHPHEYGIEVLASGLRGYEQEVIDMLSRLLSKRLELSALTWDGIEFHSGEQNARLVKGEVSSFGGFKGMANGQQTPSTTTKLCTTAATNRGTCATRTCLRR